MESVKAQRVMDELEILRLLATLAQAVDDRHEARYRACFADEVMGASPSGDPDSWLAVSSQEYAHRSIEAVSAMAWTHHKLCNPVVDLMGDRATAKADVVVDMEASGSEGRLEHLTIGGRYELEFARLDQGWRISKRRLVRRYVVGDPMLADQARRAGAYPTQPQRVVSRDADVRTLHPDVQMAGAGRAVPALDAALEQS
jgi:hypothetical protein